MKVTSPFSRYADTELMIGRHILNRAGEYALEADEGPEWAPSLRSKVIVSPQGGIAFQVLIPDFDPQVPRQCVVLGYFETPIAPMRSALYV
jgi:hypothetical protein